jgi:transglutaminase-like putative cysteine protease
MKTSNWEEYLQPSELCDFDRSPKVRAKAKELTEGCRPARQKFQRLFRFVKELPYGLEDWDVTASETLAKGWGMCSGKSNLLVALLRSLGIPARYRVYRIRAEVNLWLEVTAESALSQRLGAAPSQQDHVDCEVWLGKWHPCDPARDTALERGMKALGMPLKREIIPDASGHIGYTIDPARDTALERGMKVLGMPLKREIIPDASGHVGYTILADFDDWARQRQRRRMIRQDRAQTFALANEQFSRIRALGQSKGPA